MIHGSGWSASCTIATLVRTRVSVSSMSLNWCSPRSKHAASVVSPPCSNTSRFCLSRSRQSHPLLAAPADQVGAAVKAVADQHRPDARGQKASDRLERLALLGKADRALGLL